MIAELRAIRRARPGAAGARGRRGAARRAHDLLRRRADGDGGVPDRPGGGAARDPLAHRRDRRRALLRPDAPAGPVRRAARHARRGAPRPRARARRGLRADRAAGARRSSRATAAAICSPAWWPTSTPCRTCTCGPSGPRWPGALAAALSRSAPRPRSCPARPSCSPPASWSRGVAVPALAGALLPRRRAPAGGRAGRRRRRSSSSCWAPRPEIAAYGGEEAARARVRAADRRLVRLARRDALLGGAADGLGVAVAGATLAGVLAVAAQASAAGRLDPVSSRCSACSRSPRSRPSSRCPPRLVSSPRRSAPGAGSSS